REVGGWRRDGDRAGGRVGIGITRAVDHGQRGDVGPWRVEGDVPGGLRDGRRGRGGGEDPRVLSGCGTRSEGDRPTGRYRHIGSWRRDHARGWGGRIRRDLADLPLRRPTGPVL